MPTIFIAGTDTEVGKTWVSRQLLERFRSERIPALGYKPVAAGCEPIGQGWENDDARQLRDAGHIRLPYPEINTYALREPIAPHIAAEREGVAIDPQRIVLQAEKLARQAEWLLVEGAGGLRVPLNADSDYLDLVRSANWPVLLVVGMRLGCINHALLSGQALDAAGLRWAWLANELPPKQPFLAENIATLKTRMSAPQLCLHSENWLQGLIHLAS